VTSLAGKLGRLLLATALLAGGHAALVHPLQHVDVRGGFVHAAGGHDPHEHEGGEASVLCDAIAAMAAVVGGAAACFAAEAPAHGAVLALAESARDNAPLNAASRDPPQFL
jgi:hypothetical protein